SWCHLRRSCRLASSAWRPVPPRITGRASWCGRGRRRDRAPGGRTGVVHFPFRLPRLSLRETQGLMPDTLRWEVDMARPMGGARPLGLAALIALFGLAGCTYEGRGYGGYDYGNGQYYGNDYGNGQYYGNDYPSYDYGYRYDRPYG